MKRHWHPFAFEPCHSTPPRLLPVPGREDGWLAACHLLSGDRTAGVAREASETC